MGDNDSLGTQFNQQYEETIDLVRSRAIWRVGERRDELEAFRCECPNCGYASEHRRVDITRHRLVFGKAIRQVEAARPMVQCQRCGQERHARDVGELVVPTTIRLADAVRSTAASERESAPSDAMTAALTAFREEASGPVRSMVFTELVTAIGTHRTDLLRAIGRELFLTTGQIDAALRS